jgi:maleate isomerase
MKKIRFGIIVPSSNTTLEVEYGKVLPPEISLHTGRIRLKDVTVKALIEMEKSVEEEASKLADASVDIIGFGCTSGSLVRGFRHDKEIVSKIEQAAGKPAVATAGAVLEAFKKVGSYRLAVATPYIKEINVLEKEFLEGNGFEVVDIRGLNIVKNTEIGLTEGKTVMDLVRSLNHKDASGIFISCTNLPTVGIIKKIEEELGKPVISSNTATLWYMLKKIGFNTKFRDHGRLLTDY